MRSDADFFTCRDLFNKVDVFDDAAGPGPLALLSDGTAWTCPYLEEQYGCDCTDCGCVDTTPTNISCPGTCSSPADGWGSSFTCDETIEQLDYRATCADLEANHGCDCHGCMCAEGYCANTVVLSVNGNQYTCEDLNSDAAYCAALHRGELDDQFFSYETDCIAHGCECDECLPECLGDNTCDDWLWRNQLTLTCADLEAAPYGCDCSGCACQPPPVPCDAQCGPPAGTHDGLQAFADDQGIVNCDDWGAFFTEETFTCAYLEYEWGCDCGGCNCTSAPECQTVVECKACVNDVFSGNCDEIFAGSDYRLSCEISESTFGCDCAGCSCTQPPPVVGCNASCLGYTCDEVLPVFGGDLSCESLESLGFDCEGCTGCEFYEICDSYRFGFSNGFLANQPALVAQVCEGTPIRQVGVFSFCDCVNACEETASCASFDNAGLNCRLFAADQCAAPMASIPTAGVWHKPRA